MHILSQVGSYSAFCAEIARTLSDSLAPSQCEGIVRERLMRREKNFLDLMQHAVFTNPRSPYLPLLRGAGISLEDIRATVEKKGLESALSDLRNAGVYLTFEEYKGRRPVIRHGKTYPIVKPADLHHRRGGGVYDSYTGGSTGPSVRISQNLSFQKDHAVLTGLIFAKSMPPDGKVALWRSEPPSASLNTLIRFSLIGYPPAAWFTPVANESGRQSWQQRLLLRMILQTARNRGIPIPDPEYVPLSEAHRIGEWIVEQKRSGFTCLIQCNVSSAVRICEAAKRRHQDIGGARFFMISEPLTEAKREEIEAVGAVPLSVYSAVDAGRLALPCENPSSADDMHVCTDVVAMITGRRFHPAYGETVGAFLITTLLPTHPLFLLNVEFDDFGNLEERDCRCRLADLGLKLHVDRVRSFAKLTTQGTAIPFADVDSIIERALPRRFGGSSVHYQLLEEEVGNQTRLTLVVSPLVGPLSESIVIRAFLDEMNASEPQLRSATYLWEQSGAVRVVRAEPIVTQRGKLMPVRVLRDYERSQLPL